MIKYVERELARVAAGARVAEVEQPIRAVDLEGKVAEVQKRLAARIVKAAHPSHVS